MMGRFDYKSYTISYVLYLDISLPKTLISTRGLKQNIANSFFLLYNWHCYFLSPARSLDF